MTKYWQLLLAGLSLTVVAGLTLLPVALSDGWPMNHEFNLPWSFNSFYLRTQIYAEHMNLGDWFPIWSAADNDGFGSPQPLLYHKLFYLSSGALYVTLDQMKASILLSLLFWLIVGALGNFALIRRMGCSRSFAWFGGAMLLLANYTLTNWLIRGAMAEFSAAMLIPWVLLAYTNWLADSSYRASGMLGLALGLVFLAHAVLAFYLVILFGVTWLLLLASRQISCRLSSLYSMVFGMTCFFIVTGVYMAAMMIVGADYEMRRIIPASFLPENQIKPLSLYFWDTQWHWGKAWDSYTVQLDAPVLILLVGGLLLKLFHTRKNLPAFSAGDGRGSNAVPGIALAVLCTLAMFLQTQWAITFYQAVPGAAYLQFPWRLLSVLTPCLIALALAVWKYEAQGRATLAILITVCCMLLICGAWYPRSYGATPIYDSQMNRFRFSAFGEYLPAVLGTEIPYTAAELHDASNDLGCKIKADSTMDPGLEENLVRRYTLSCTKATVVPLPVFRSRLHHLEVESKHGTTFEGCAVLASYPALCAVTLKDAGSYQVTVWMPTMRAMLASSFTLALDRLRQMLHQTF